jgi:hypothetical protein
MQNRVVFVGGIITLAIGLGGYWLAGGKVGKQLCDIRDGKWASASGACITRDCYNNGSCGSWANPAASCTYLSIDSPRSEVYFQLGMPESSTETLAIWNAGKGSAEKITVEFKANRLVSLDCPT